MKNLNIWLFLAGITLASPVIGADAYCEKYPGTTYCKEKFGNPATPTANEPKEDASDDVQVVTDVDEIDPQQRREVEAEFSARFDFEKCPEYAYYLGEKAKRTCSKYTDKILAKYFANGKSGYSYSELEEGWCWKGNVINSEIEHACNVKLAKEVERDIAMINNPKVSIEEKSDFCDIHAGEDAYVGIKNLCEVFLELAANMSIMQEQLCQIRNDLASEDAKIKKFLQAGVPKSAVDRKKYDELAASNKAMSKTFEATYKKKVVCN